MRLQENELERAFLLFSFFFFHSYACRINLGYFVLFSGSEAKRNYIKSEPGSGALPGSGFFASQLGPSQNGPKSGLISVAITLHPTAAEVKERSLLTSVVFHIHILQMVDVKGAIAY